MTLSQRTLDAYLDDALSDSRLAQVEKALRDSPDLQHQLTELIQKRDQGEHSVGALWRRERITCPSRDELSAYHFQGLEEARLDYIRFHLEISCCGYCQANLADLDPTHSGKLKCDNSFKESSSHLVSRKRRL